MKLTVSSEKLAHCALALVVAYAVMLNPTNAMAGDVLGTVLCEVVGWLTGPVGAGIATLAIIVVGVGALMGKVSWGMAIIVGIGVAVVFGATEITSALGATETC